MVLVMKDAGRDAPASRIDSSELYLLTGLFNDGSIDSFMFAISDADISEVASAAAFKPPLVFFMALADRTFALPLTLVDFGTSYLLCVVLSSGSHELLSALANRH
jgi:hypothetical protein